MSASRRSAGSATAAAGACTAATASNATGPRVGPRVGYEHVHAAIDDHTHLAYAEIHRDEKSGICAGFLRRAATWFAGHAIEHLERVMTDNGMPTAKAKAWHTALQDLGAQAPFTRSYRPQTNRKIERFNRTMRLSFVPDFELWSRDERSALR